MRIRFGGFFGRIWDFITSIFSFGKMVKESREFAKQEVAANSSGHDNEVVQKDLTSDDVRDVAEQVGLFEQINLNDQSIINDFCGKVALRFNASNRTTNDLNEILVETLKEEGASADQNAVNLFIESFKEGYLYNN